MTSFNKHGCIGVEKLLMHHLEELAHQTPGPIVHVALQLQVALCQILCPQF